MWVTEIGVICPDVARDLSRSLRIPRLAAPGITTSSPLIMQTPIVVAHDIHKHFGHLHVLKGVDLEVAERELVFVIGPSGSGKSTLLRCLQPAGRPSSGSITVAGIDMLSPHTDINHARQHIGGLQSFNLYPHMTALENVTLALRKVTGKSPTEQKKIARPALERVRNSPIVQVGRPSCGRPAAAPVRPCSRNSPSNLYGDAVRRNSPVHWIPSWWARCWRSCARCANRA